MAIERIKETVLLSIALAMTALMLGMALPNHNVTSVIFPLKNREQQAQSRNHSERVGFIFEVPKEWKRTFENEDKKVTLSAKEQTEL